MDRVRAFHRSLPGYAPTPLRDLGGGVWLKDESERLGLPAFKVLGASWAAEQAIGAGGAGLRELVTASAGNHGRAVARVAAWRGLACRVFLPERSLPARRQAIEGEGATVVVEGDYEHVVARAAEAGRAAGVLEIADVGTSQTAYDVIDGYSTLFAEITEAGGDFDALLVPVGVGSLAAAAARWGSATGTRVIGVEPENAACLTAALAAGEPVTIETPGTALAGMDCAVVSEAAWPDLRDGIADTLLVSDDETAAAMDALEEQHGIRVGECGAAPYAALAKLPDPGRVVLVATEGRITGSR